MRTPGIRPKSRSWWGLFGDSRGPPPKNVAKKKDRLNSRSFLQGAHETFDLEQPSKAGPLPCPRFGTPLLLLLCFPSRCDLRLPHAARSPWACDQLASPGERERGSLLGGSAPRAARRPSRRGADRWFLEPARGMQSPPVQQEVSSPPSPRTGNELYEGLAHDMNPANPGGQFNECIFLESLHDSARPLSDHFWYTSSDHRRSRQPTWWFTGVSRVFHECFTGESRVNHGCITESR